MHNCSQDDINRLLPFLNNKIKSSPHSSCDKENESSNNNQLVTVNRSMTRSEKKTPEKDNSAKSKSKVLTPVKSGCTPNKKKSKGSSSPPTTRSVLLESRMSDPPQRNLNDDQREVLAKCCERENVFYTGGAGCGKSYLLRVIIEEMGKIYNRSEIFVTATTGLAACAIGGITVHQFAGLRCGEEYLDISANKRIQVCIYIYVSLPLRYNN